MTNGAIQSTTSVNTPSLIAGNGSSAVQILPVNTGRIGLSIQNVGSTPAYVLIGGQASASVYHIALKGGSAANDGLGASITFTAGAVPTGVITFFGASTAVITAIELAP